MHFSWQIIKPEQKILIISQLDHYKPVGSDFVVLLGRWGSRAHFRVSVGSPNLSLCLFT